MTDMEHHSEVDVVLRCRSSHMGVPRDAVGYTDTLTVRELRVAGELFLRLKGC